MTDLVKETKGSMLWMMVRHSKCYSLLPGSNLKEKEKVRADSANELDPR